MVNYELDLLDTLIKNSEADERWYSWLVRGFIALAGCFLLWTIFALFKRSPTLQPYFQAAAAAATTLICAIPRKSVAAARLDRDYYTWMKTKWQEAQLSDDSATIAQLSAEFQEIRKKNFGKGLGA